MENKKILVDLERLRYPNSGLGYYCKCLAKGLEEVNHKHLPISFYTHLSHYNNRVKYSPLHKLFNFSTYGFNVLHITHQNQSCFTRTLNAHKLIVTLHDLNFLYEAISKKKRCKLIQSAKGNLQKADIIVCISNYVKQDLLKHQHLFNLKKNVQIEVIHNGIILNLHYQEKSICSPFNDFKNKNFLLSIGVLADKKQQHLLLQMMPYLPKDMSIVLVYSSKKPDYYNYLQSIITDLGIQERVFFLENITNEEKAFLIEYSLGLVHPSIAEGFGIPPIESMAAGKPVFVSQATSIPEICGNEAYYFQNNVPADMAHIVIQGLSDFEQDAYKKERLKDWTKQYQYTAMAQKYLELYYSCL